MIERPVKYQDKFIAFVDILGFKQIVERSAIDGEAEAIARMIGRLATKNDIAQYEEYGAEICPCSGTRSADLGMQISQISDCVVVSAEVSPAGAINIVNFCRRVAERLLLRECVLCQGYLTRGKIVHEGMMFFGPGYQAAFDGEKRAAAIEWQDEVLGTPFIEIDPAVVSYLEDQGDDCTRMMFSRMTLPGTAEAYVSPYGVFQRLADWASDPSKSPEERQAEFDNAYNIIEQIERNLGAPEPTNPRAEEKLRICRQELLKARGRLAEAEDLVSCLKAPFPAR